MTIDDLFDEYGVVIYRQANKAARKALRHHRGYVEFDDLQQEALVWVVKHQRKAEEYLTDDSRHGANKMGVSMYRTAHAYAMKERMRKDGTKPNDYYFYSLAVVAELLPDALATDRGTGAGRTITDYEGLPRGKSSPAEGGTRLAAVIDVRSAVEQLEIEDRTVLWHRFAGDGKTLEEVAKEYGVTKEAAFQRLERALGHLCEVLGGEAPPRSERRKVKSNAQSISETRKQNDDA